MLIIWFSVTWQVDQSQCHQGDGGQRLVDRHQWQFVEVVPSLVEVRQQDVPQEEVTIEEEEEEEGG